MPKSSSKIYYDIFITMKFYLFLFLEVFLSNIQVCIFIFSHLTMGENDIPIWAFQEND